MSTTGVAAGAVGVEPHVFHLSSVRDFHDQRAEVLATLEREDVALLRGLVEPSVVREALARIASSFSRANDSLVDHKSHAVAPRDVPNYQRLMLGEHGEGEKNRALCMRIFHNPSWNEDEWGLREVFRTMTRVRNAVYDVEPDYCLDGPDGDVYTLFRVHHYPAGGGFLGAHRDGVAASVPERAGLQGYVQALLVMSEKGADFEAGGGYYYKDGRRVLYEEFSRPGDILLYNGQTLHGVQTVDPYTPIDLDSAAGRYSASVTLYRVYRREMSMG